MKQIVPDPVSKETIQRKLDKANKAEIIKKCFFIVIPLYLYDN